MNKMAIEKRNKLLAEKVQDIEPKLSFTILEIGALPLEGKQEPFYQLLDIFPDSKIIAFEVDEELCDQLNNKARTGIKFFPIALGRTEERRVFYQTFNPMCSSLYKPNEKLIDLYQNMEFARLKSVENIETVSLDYFIKEYGIDTVDFIKIDIQGAELEVFQGGVNTLKSVVAIVCEVEFIQHYIDQPLFGDVCAFLAENKIMFHKFLGMAGRTLKPIAIDNNPNYPTQHIWCDAVFIKDIFKLAVLDPEKLLKMGLLAFIYGSPDVTYQCFKYYDQKKGTNLHERMFDM